MSEVELDEEVLSSSQEGIRPKTHAEEQAEERERKKKQALADRERLFGKAKKDEKAGRRKLTKEVIGEIMESDLRRKIEGNIKAKRKDMEMEEEAPEAQVEFTEDEREYLTLLKENVDADRMTQERGESDDDFWERQEIAHIEKHDFLHANLKEGQKPGRDYLGLAEKLYLKQYGPDRIPPHMKYPNQPEFADEKPTVYTPIKSLSEVSKDELAIPSKDKINNYKDYANNVQKMYNQVQKFKYQRSLEHAAMGIEAPTPQVANSKFSGQDRICGAVILERYPTISPLPKQHEIEHEQWEQSVRLQTCRPVIPWYIWKMEWEKLTEAQKNANDSGKGKKGGGGGGGKAEAAKKKKAEDVGDSDELPKMILTGPDWGLPKVVLPELSPEDALERSKNEARRLKPYNDWIEYWKKWEAAPRETEDDVKDNRKSINRELAKKLYLIVRKNRKENEWVFPTSTNTETESIRQTAERSLKEAVGKNLQVYFGSNAPVGFYKYFYNNNQTQEKYQAEANKVFYMRARFFHGDIAIPRKSGYVDYLWVTRDQMKEYFTKDYYERVINFIWPDPN